MNLGLFKSLSADDRAVTAVEFSLIVTPLLVLILGGLELAYQSSLRVLAQGALGDAARMGTVQNPNVGGSGTIEQRLQAKVQEAIQALAPQADVAITQRSYRDFSNVGKPEAFTDSDGNGRYTPGECFFDENGNGRFDNDVGLVGRGGGNDVIYYDATVTAPNLIPIPAFIPGGNGIVLNIKTAVRNQPYSSQTPAPTSCRT